MEANTPTTTNVTVGMFIGSKFTVLLQQVGRSWTVEERYPHSSIFHECANEEKALIEYEKLIKKAK